jgi:TIR domain
VQPRPQPRRIAPLSRAWYPASDSTATLNAEDKMSNDIFLAYSRSDETEAKALSFALERWGYSIWYDVGIKPGAVWSEVIDDQFGRSACVIALLSESSLKSFYVRVYLKKAMADGNLVAVAVQDRLDDTVVRELLGETKVLDISEWRLTRDPRKLDEFLFAVSAIAGRKPVWTEATEKAPFRASKLQTPGDQRDGHDIFLSYKREERESISEFVTIFTNYGFSVWWDQLIPAGANWGFAIDRALQISRSVVVFWTPLSVLSQEVYTEAEYGMSKNAYFPVLLERCEVPPRMRRNQWVDLTRSKPLDSEPFHVLIDQLKNKVQVAS